MRFSEKRSAAVKIYKFKVSTLEFRVQAGSKAGRHGCKEQLREFYVFASSCCTPTPTEARNRIGKAYNFFRCFCTILLALKRTLLVVKLNARYVHAKMEFRKIKHQRMKEDEARVARRLLNS